MIEFITHIILALDCLPYELYVFLTVCFGNICKKQQDNTIPSAISRCLMILLWKYTENCNIQNKFRPMTLLNTMLKVLVKVLAKGLARVDGNLIV